MVGVVSCIVGKKPVKEQRWFIPTILTAMKFKRYYAWNKSV